MPWTDRDLERLYLYGRLLLLELPAGDNDPMPQVSKSVQLTHLRIAVTSDAAIALTATDEPGIALPGEGKGRGRAGPRQALRAHRGDERQVRRRPRRRGQGLGRPAVGSRQGRRRHEAVALNNDRSQYEMVLEQKIKDLLVDRHDKNGELFDLFFANPDFQVSLVRYLAGTYDEFRKESIS